MWKVCICVTACTRMVDSVRLCVWKKESFTRTQAFVWRENKSLRYRKRDTMQNTDSYGPYLLALPYVVSLLMWSNLPAHLALWISPGHHAGLAEAPSALRRWSTCPASPFTRPSLRCCGGSEWTCCGGSANSRGRLCWGDIRPPSPHSSCACSEACHIHTALRADINGQNGNIRKGDRMRGGGSRIEGKLGEGSGNASALDEVWRKLIKVN